MGTMNATLLCKRKIRFTKADIGCYSDSVNGHEWLRQRLASMVQECDAEIAKSLRGEMPDDSWDEDAALDLLNEHTDNDLVWTFYDGNLMLTPIEDNEEE